MIEEQLKKINELGFQFRKSKDTKEKDNIENELKDILLNLKKEAFNKFQSESDIKKFLDNIIKFNNYSFNNQVLIWLQNPDAEYVSSFKTFSKMGYKINKGAKGIKIFIPNFYNLAKIKIDDTKYEIKPYYLLNEDEKKDIEIKTMILYLFINKNYQGLVWVMFLMLKKLIYQWKLLIKN